jgi:murein DD-endopeptidase MepM/ murein hydrolase activator NlpD
MKRRGKRRGRVIPILFAFFCGGLVTGWLIHEVVETPTAVVQTATEPVRLIPDVADGTSGSSTTKGPMLKADPKPDAHLKATATSGRVTAIEELQERGLRLPIDHAKVEAMKGQFEDPRGSRLHEAVDILAPRHTPIHAVENGTIARLFTSQAGGLTIYQFDPSGRFCYYYAHLQRYADHLREGASVREGDVIGYVGTTGNAPPNTPHLHFAIFELTPERRWWQGRAIDPYTIFNN